MYIETLSKKSDLYKNYKPAKKIDNYSLNKILRKSSPFPKDDYLFSFYSIKELKKILSKYFNKIKIETFSRTYRNNKEYFETLVIIAKKMSIDFKGVDNINKKEWDKCLNEIGGFSLYHTYDQVNFYVKTNENIKNVSLFFLFFRSKTYCVSSFGTYKVK